MVAAPGFAKHPNHQVEITPHEKRIRLALGGVVIGETDRALVLAESGYPVRHYLPIADLDPARLVESERESYCPFKGTARYWHLKGPDGRVVENAVWGYDEPYDECAPLTGHAAFYMEAIDGLTQEET